MSALLAYPSPVEKRVPNVREIADTSVGSLRLATYRLLLSLQKLSTAQLQNEREILEHLRRSVAGAGLKAEQNSYKEIFMRIVNRGAFAGMQSLKGRAVRKDIASSMSFDLLNPRVVEFVERYNLVLISMIARDTRSAIQGILLNAFRSGIAPAGQGRLIRPLIGLTSRQVQAIDRYRAALEAGQYASAMQNALRDKRFDASALRALRNKERLSRDMVNRMVTRYAERQLKYRADMIARTETIRAAVAGQRESWRQAKEQGLIPDAMRQHWIVATDERLCPQCSEIPHMNPGGVPIGGNFSTPYGPVDQPPAHPNCRCALGLK